DFQRILEAAQMETAKMIVPLHKDGGISLGPAYASPEVLKMIEEFSVRVAVEELRKKYPGASIIVKPRNNPGFDLLVRPQSARGDDLFVEVKGTTRGTPHFFMTEGEVQFS